MYVEEKVYRGVIAVNHMFVELSCHCLRNENHPLYTWSLVSFSFSFSLFLAS
jgi:hypothetical protein